MNSEVLKRELRSRVEARVAALSSLVRAHSIVSVMTALETVSRNRMQEAMEAKDHVLASKWQKIATILGKATADIIQSGTPG